VKFDKATILPEPRSICISIGKDAEKLSLGTSNLPKEVQYRAIKLSKRNSLEYSLIGMFVKDNC